MGFDCSGKKKEQITTIAVKLNRKESQKNTRENVHTIQNSTLRECSYSAIELTKKKAEEKTHSKTKEIQFEVYVIVKDNTKKYTKIT